MIMTHDRFSNSGQSECCSYDCQVAGQRASHRLIPEPYLSSVFFPLRVWVTSVCVCARTYSCVLILLTADEQAPIDQHVRLNSYRIRKCL
jgi:hypothetical protein